MMPRLDGVELCRKLKADERTSHIPVILLTAKADKSSKLEGLQIGADDYLAKPFDAEELLLLIGNRIAQRKKLRERFSREITQQPKDIAITSADERFLEKAIAIVEEHMDDPAFNVKSFVQEMPLGHMQVYRKLEALTDQSPVKFIRFLRLKRAAAKIAQREDTISQIAYSVGFNNLSYFAHSFKQQFGCSPSEYVHQEAE
jgi:AraC-like DNA-binding protein